MKQETPAGHSRPDNRLRILLVLGIVVVTVSAFYPLFGNGFINYDDPGYVYKNPEVRSGLSPATLRWAFTTTQESNWHPLTWISIALDCSLFGLNPGAHHAMSLFIHILNAIILFFLLDRLTGAVWESAAVALIFAIHPLHVESVAWASERKDVLSTLFWLLTASAYARYAGSGSKAWYAAALLLFAAGLMAKPMLVSLPFVLLLMDYWPLGRLGSAGTDRRIDRRALVRCAAEKIPFVFLAAVSGIVTLAVQQPAMKILPLTVRCGNAVVSYLHYLSKTFVPVGLSVFYPHTGLLPPAWELALAVIIVGGITLLCWRMRYLRPYLPTGWFWFLGTLIPVLGLVQVGLQSMADRYMYIPMIGLSIAIVWSAAERARRSRNGMRYLAFTGGAVIVLLAAVTSMQARYWRDSETLFRHAVAVTDDNHLALNNLGAALADSGRHAEALTYLARAESILPEQETIHRNMARSLAALGREGEAAAEYEWMLRRDPGNARLNEQMGDLLFDEGKNAEAAVRYTAAADIDRDNTGVRLKLAEALLRSGGAERAERICDSILAAAPGEAGGYRIRGTIALARGDREGAGRLFLRAIACDSTDGESRNYLGLLSEQQGDAAGALAWYRSAVHFFPGLWNAEFNLGTLLARTGDLSGAEQHLLAALRLRPASADVMANLGKVYTLEGKDDLARAQFDRAIAADPSHLNARYNLALLLLRQGKSADAADLLRRILATDPGFRPAGDALAHLGEHR